MYLFIRQRRFNARRRLFLSIANLYKKSELYASFIKKLRPQPYIAFILFMLYAVTLERSFLQ